MRLFIYPLLFTVILLMLFVKVATPVMRSIHVSHTLPVHKTLYLGRDFYDDEMYHILQAAIEWNEATNGQVVFDLKKLPQRDINFSDSIIVIHVTPDYPEIMLLDNVSKRLTLGYFNGNNIPTLALVDERMNDDIYNLVILHELGHALGLEHLEGINGINTLMYPSIDLCSSHISDTDLLYFCKLYNCDSKKFHVIN